jgi:non-specific serine/threonine protein kinase
MAADDEPLANVLPHRLSPLIGRDDEAAEIRSLLATARLFTLTGAGGCGKTRLAAQVAAESQAAFPDGVRWVELGALVDPTLIPHVIAARCGVGDRGGPAVLGALAAALRPRRLLLVLDNCEHLLNDCAGVVEYLLAVCPGLHILTTSREALALPGEMIWLVTPLRVPEQDAMSTVEDLLAHDAVALFVARATEVQPWFRLTAENAASVVDICRRLDGLPLALELAAVRLRVLSPAELAVRLDDALRVLTRGSRTAPPRQQTLRATLDWSYRLLTDSERAVFGRLGVFAGSFSLESAEQVCSGADIDAADVFDIVSRLVEQSLASVHDEGEETRFRLLEPVRQYARERLEEAGQTARTERRHRDWFALLAGQAAAGLAGPEQGHWLDRLETEHDNLRAALRWSLTHDDAPVAGQMAAGIWQLWISRGSRQEGDHWLDQILTALPEPKPLRAHLLWIAGILARPDAEKAERYFEESLALSRTVSDRAGAGRALGSLGFMAQTLGEHQRAISSLEESLALARDATDAPTLSRVLNGLSLSLLQTGDIERAARLCQEARDLCRLIGDSRGAAAATANLGLIWQARGDERRASELWEESLTERRRIGDLGGVAHLLVLLGNQALSQGTPARAIAMYRESLALRRRTGDENEIAPVLEGLAAIGAGHDELIPSIQLAAFAASLRATIGTPLPPRERHAHDRTLAALRRRADPAAFARVWTEGQALTLAQAVAVAEAVRSPENGVGDRGSVPLDQAPLLSSAAPALTAREIDVLRLLTFGLTYAQIAESLFISPRTVDSHVRAIFGKLDVHSRTAATRIALQDGLI